MNSQINDEKFVYFLKIDFTVISAIMHELVLSEQGTEHHR